MLLRVNGLHLKLRNSFVYFIPNPPEFFFHVLLAADKGVRIVKSYMQAIVDLAGKNRTVLLGTTADCDHKVPGLLNILHHTLWIMICYVYSYLCHDLHGERMNFRCRSDSRRTYFCGGVKILKDAMSHLAAASVAGT
mgnify:CR=1 FL=1